MRKYVPEPGCVLQAYSYALDPTPVQDRAIRNHFGARRFAHNWAVAQMKADIWGYREFGITGERPSLAGMRRRWNRHKDVVAARNGKDMLGVSRLQPWWPQVSKEAFSSGIADAVDAYWNWQKSRSGQRHGAQVGFPKFKRKGSDGDRYRVSTGSFGPVDDRHVQIPRVGTVHVHERLKKMLRFQAKGWLKILSMTIRRSGKRILVVFQVDVCRWASRPPETKRDTVGVDAGVRRLATVASPERVLEAVENRRTLDSHLAKLRTLYRNRSRCTSKNSCRYRQRNTAISALHRTIASQRRHEIHVLTTRLAKSHGRIVVEGVDFSKLMEQKGLPGVRKRRRDLADAALAEIRRQLRYKAAWYGSELVEADRFFPSSKLCTACGIRSDIGWDEHWNCTECGSHHQRDDNAAVNLARYPEGEVGPVGAFSSVEGASDFRAEAVPGEARSQVAQASREPLELAIPVVPAKAGKGCD